MGVREEFSKNAEVFADRAQTHADKAKQVALRASQQVAKLTLRRKKIRENSANSKPGSLSALSEIL
jgi:hypothetical protein